MNYGVSQYRQTEVLTASRVQVVVLLYDGALQSMKLAQTGILQNNLADKARFLRRALTIVAELSNVLDMERGGDIATSLRRIYDYVTDELTQANVKHEAARIDGPIRCLSTLREAWEQVAKQQQALPQAVGG